MKLIVQIPCFNEEETLPATVADIPREIEGIEKVEILIIDDGSTDRTVKVAQELGVDHVVRNKANLGLARTFAKGLDACLEAGADIIVNTDGDNQYAGKDIAKLVGPIVDGQADIVVGDRQTSKIGHFSPFKKLLQRFGSAVVRNVSGVNVPDAVSGFRAFSRDVAMQINIVSTFSYTIEMLVQAGNKSFAVASVPVETNAVTRPSRLFTSIPDFIRKQMITVLRMYVMYRPLRFFVYLGAVLGVVGAAPVIRFLIFYMQGQGGGNVQSLILGGVLLMMSFLCFLSGILADLISFNRRLQEMALVKARETRFGEGNQSGDLDQR